MARAPLRSIVKVTIYTVRRHVITPGDQQQQLNQPLKWVAPNLAMTFEVRDRDKVMEPYTHTPAAEVLSFWLSPPRDIGPITYRYRLSDHLSLL